MSQGLGAAHVGHEPPLDLHDRELGVRPYVADVCTECDLQAAAEGRTVHRGNHRQRELLPDEGRALTRVCGTLTVALEGALDVLVALSALHGLEACEVQARAESATLSGEDDGAHRRVVGELPARGDQSVEHRGVDRIHLLRSVQANVCNSIHDLDRYALRHAHPSRLV